MGRRERGSWWVLRAGALLAAMVVVALASGLLVVGAGYLDADLAACMRAQAGGEVPGEYDGVDAHIRLLPPSVVCEYRAADGHTLEYPLGLPAEVWMVGATVEALGLVALGVGVAVGTLGRLFRRRRTGRPRGSRRRRG